MVRLWFILLKFSCGYGSKVYSLNFQLAQVSVPFLRADFLQHFNLLIDIKGRCVIHADCPECVIFQASPGPHPAFRSIAFLSAPQQVRKLLEDFPDASPPVFANPQRLDPEKLEAAKEEFFAMEKAGIIQRSTSPWSSSYGEEEGQRLEAMQ